MIEVTCAEPRFAINHCYFLNLGIYDSFNWKRNDAVSQCKLHSFPNISGVPMMTSTVRGAGNSNEQQLQQAESLLPRVGSFFFKLLYITNNYSLLWWCSR